MEAVLVMVALLLISRVANHFWKHPHRSWKVWGVFVLLTSLILVYVFSDNLFLRPGKPAVRPTREVTLP